MEIALNNAINNYGMAVDTLMLASYAFNRNHAPSITPEQWSKSVYPDALKLEALYQASLKSQNGELN
jgi:hypothetical protein